jgi:hypothetical protein
VQLHIGESRDSGFVLRTPRNGRFQHALGDAELELSYDPFWAYAGSYRACTVRGKARIKTLS